MGEGLWPGKDPGMRVLGSEYVRRGDLEVGERSSAAAKMESG